MRVEIAGLSDTAGIDEILSPRQNVEFFKKTSFDDPIFNERHRDVSVAVEANLLELILKIGISRFVSNNITPTVWVVQRAMY